MKKNYFITLVVLLFAQAFWAQTTETFETENHNSSSFTDNGQVFNISSQAQGPFDVQANFPGTGWSGTAADNRYIDNSSFTAPNIGVQFTISSAGAVAFQLKSLYLYLSKSDASFPAVGSCTIEGKLAGSTVFTATSSTGFNSSFGVNNGFTFINMATYGGSNNASASIDEYVISTTGNIAYVALDAMSWQAGASVPTVSTTAASNIGAISATLGGNVTATGGASVTERGIVWATTTNPTTSNNKVTNGSGTGIFSGTVGSLPPATLIHFRAYAINSAGTAYGSDLTFTTNAALGGTISKTDVSCNGGNNGTATVSVTGGKPSYSYSWSPSGGTAATATGLGTGTYTCTITDAETTQITRTITVNQPAAALGGTISKTDVSCNGGNNGTATVSATGGTTPYSYSWSPSGGTNATATGLGTGTYTVTVTDFNGCQITRTTTVNQPAAALGGTISKTDVSCNGGNNGTATVSVTGGTTPYSYSWSPSGGTNATAIGLGTGTYTVTVTDFNGCQITRTTTVNQPAAALGGTISKTDVSCNGGNNGTATVSVTGGTTPYSYSWSPSGGTNATATGLGTGTYTVTVTDFNGCQITRTTTVNQPAAALGGTISKTDVSCNGGNNGTATVSVTGGTTPYSYSWSPSGGTNATATGLGTGTYTVTVTDFNGCQITRTTTVNQPAAALGGTISKTDVSCNGGNNGTATVSATGGTTPYSYSWSPSGGTNATATGLGTGTYTVTVTDFNGCQITRTTTVNQPAAALGGTISKTDVSCNGGNNGTATVSVTGGTTPYSYSWSPSGGTNATATGLGTGTYTVTVTDFNGCQITRTTTVNQPAAALGGTISKTDVSCNGGNNGTATVSVTGGTPAYTYSWSPSGGTAATASGLSVGTYTCTITDANSCQITRTVTVNQPASFNVTPSQVNVSCNGGTNGSATVTVTGGTGAYTYSWSPSGGTAATASGLAAGTYTVTITDANTCQTTQSFMITQPAAFSVTPSQVNVSCNGGTNGSATVTVTGGTGTYTYSWAPSGGTAATASGLAAGTYTVTITDANTCQTTQSFTITQPAAFSVTPSQVNVSCNGGTNGSATVTVTGGTGAYTYSWAPSGGTAATASGLAAGTYTVTITDANTCQTTQSFTITQPAAFSVTPSQVNVSCNGGTNGSATVTVTGGTGAYTYSWAPSGGTAATASGLAAGTYTVTITDANTCQTTQSFTITQPAAFSVTPSQVNVSCNGGTNGSATVTVTGGTGAYTYSWAPSGGTAATASGLAAGTYTVTITDANTCQTTQSFTITEPGVIDNTVAVSGDTLSANQAGATYQWFVCPGTVIPGATGATYTATVDGSYGVTITLGGCSTNSDCVDLLATPDFESQKFVIYPNPGKDILNIQSGFDGDFVIANQLGQIIKEFRVTSGIVNTVAVENLSDGIYIILGRNEQRSYSQKLIIKK